MKNEINIGRHSERSEESQKNEILHLRRLRFRMTDSDNQTT
jgi:hypothetical protein